MKEKHVNLASNLEPFLTLMCVTSDTNKLKENLLDQNKPPSNKEKSRRRITLAAVQITVRQKISFLPPKAIKQHKNT